MRKRAKESGRHVVAVLASLDLLDGFVGNPAQSVSEISSRTGFPRSRVMRLAGTLESRGYLNFDGESGRYRLGPQLMTLGRSFESGLDVIALARPVLREVAAITGESASLYSIEGLDRVVLARESGTHPVRFAVTEGERTALHAGAAGKVLLAFSPESVREATLARSLPRLTPQTITDRAALERELARIHSQGYAASRGERIADVSSLAVPVFNRNGTLAGAIAIAAPVNRMSAAVRAQHVQTLIAAGRRLTESLGGTPPVERGRTGPQSVSTTMSENFTTAEKGACQ